MAHRTLHNHLVRVPLDQVRPTQITVGYAEVRLKRDQWRKLARKERKHRLAQQWFPSILGPKGRFYIVDHHHLGLALLDDGVDHAWVMVLRDLSTVEPTMFWRLMEHHRWTHPYDAKGRRRGFEAIPGRLRDLVDDPYRSLAGMVRTAGGYAKDTEPFSEFLWADFFRPRIARARILRSLQATIDEAVVLARSSDASFLPGWTGASA
ncbi:MAG TPA: ParB-like protein [Burkholderiaceae bacterium]|nr:ParB-like protein [Burkholderiaceae bacterium]